MPFLSVIIPIYNVEKYLEQCVESVINQKLNDIEIILVEDGSPDNCAKICDRYAEEIDYIHVIHKENGGLSSARNAGLSMATGEYIIFMDSDDWWNPDVNMQEVLTTVRQKPNVEMFLFSSLDYIEGKGLFKRKEHERLKNVSTNSVEEYYQGLLDNGNLEVSADTKIFKRDFLKKNGLYFQEGITSEDCEWIFRVLRKLQKVEILDIPLYVCRLGRAGSITNSINKKSIRNLLDIVKKSIEYYEKNNEKSNLKKYEYCYCAYLWFCALGLSNQLPIEDKKNMRTLFKETSFVCTYSQSRKTKMAYKAYKILGMEGTAILLGNYLKLKRKMNLNKRKQ